MILDIFDIRESLSFFFNHKIFFCILLELMFDRPAFPLQSFRKWKKGWVLPWQRLNTLHALNSQIEISNVASVVFSKGIYETLRFKQKCKQL